MRLCLPAVLACVTIGIAACGTPSDPPTGLHPSVRTQTFYAAGNPPPPPLDTTSFTSTSSGATFQSPVTYFVNKPGNIAWIAFGSGNGTTASPDARLMYKAKTGQTIGHGTLTSDNGTLDLSTVSIVAEQGVQPFHQCDEKGCGTAPFTTSDGQRGVISVGTAPLPVTFGT